MKSAIAVVAAASCLLLSIPGDAVARGGGGKKGQSAASQKSPQAGFSAGSSFSRAKRGLKSDSQKLNKGPAIKR
jgi:hypothetical protein